MATLMLCSTVHKINKMFLLTQCFSLLQLVSNQPFMKFVGGKFAAKFFWQNVLRTPKNCLPQHLWLQHAVRVFHTVLAIRSVIRKYRV